MNRLALGMMVLLSLAAVPSSAQNGPSYARHIKPFLAKYCLECHNSKEAKSGLNLETYKGLIDGSQGGPVVTPGDADDSLLVTQVEGKDKPKMPPKTAKQPRAVEVAQLRAWVALGAKDDSAHLKTTLAAIKPRGPVVAPVAAVAYSPDGKSVVAGGYHEALVIDGATAGVVAKLPEQTGAVTALAFSRDGQYLAVASGVSGASGEVRLYRVAGKWTGALKPERVLAAHKDIIHDLAFSPDGKSLATCGYDRLVHLWDVASGKALRSLKEHSDAVYGLAFSPDGQLLASGAADRAVKVFRVADGKLLYTLSEATDWVYTVAWSPDGKHLAAAGVDKSIRVWQANAEGSKLAFSVFAHEAAVTRLVYAADGQSLYSAGEDRTVKAWNPLTMTERKVYDRQPEAVLALAVRPDHQQLALGRHDGALLLVDEAGGKVQAQPLPIKPGKKERFPTVQEVEPNDSPGTGQQVKLPATLVGGLGKTGDVDFFRFEATAGQEVGVQVLPKELGSKLEPFLQLVDVAAGRVVAESGEGFLGYTCPKAGVYALGIRDRDYRGGGDMTYKLNVGDVPVLTAVFPLGLRRGSTTDVQLQGVHLGALKSLRVVVGADAAVGSRVPLPLPQLRETPLGIRTLVVGEFPEVLGGKDGWQLATPGIGNGVIAQPGETDVWKFRAKKGQRLIVEVHARRLGSPLDSFIEILDAQGKSIPRATLRSLAKTNVTFRDHDSATAGIRIDSWSELAINDYLLVGGELLRIRELPLNPDADCTFYSTAGQRTGFLDTTPTHHANGAPMYKVAIHPPGTQFPPNGFPVVTLYHRNDDGGPGYGRDSRLFFDPPADGDYQVRVGDARGQGGPGHAYRLTVRPPRPSFAVSVNPLKPIVWQGGAVPVTVNAERFDGFDGEIKLRLEKLPPGFSAPTTSIGGDENSTAFALWADASAKQTPPLQLIAEALIDGQKVVKVVDVGAVTTKAPGDLVTATVEDAVTIKPGGQVKVNVRVERRNGFKGRVPVEVRGLPHGVRVLDIGLNGILINEQETTRSVVLFAEPWVRAREQPFVVLARREGKNTEHAAKSVLLKVQAVGK